MIINKLKIKAFLGLLILVLNQPTLAMPLDTLRLKEVQVVDQEAVLGPLNTTYFFQQVGLGDNLAASPRIGDMLNTVPGVLFRSAGGLGSTQYISVNGISGKGIRVFLDGIPVQWLGGELLTLSMPSGQLERIEVYKGITPVQFGADVLGGAVNLVSRTASENQLDIRMGVASFGTYQSSAYLHRHIGEKTALDLGAYYQRSANRYDMHEVPIPIDALGNMRTGTARRFHDAFETMGLQGTLRFRQLSWADRASITVGLNGLKKEYQHSLLQTIPWGEPWMEQWPLRMQLSWQKAVLADQRMMLRFTMGYSQTHSQITDTASRRYFWDGSSVPRTSGKGETGISGTGRSPVFDDRSAYLKGEISYRFGRHHRLFLNVLQHIITRKGEDAAARQSFSRDPFDGGQRLLTSFVGLGMQSKLKRFTNDVFVKQYDYWSRGREQYYTEIGQMVNQHLGNMGIGDGLSFEVNKHIQWKGGYEFAIRFPDQEELFGDQLLIVPNFKLKPEQSHNLNMGLSFHQASGSPWELAITGFYRAQRNQIFLATVQTNLSAYDNLYASRVMGTELSFRFHPRPHLLFWANFSALKNTLTGIGGYSNVPARYIGKAVPNIPYTFGEAHLEKVLAFGSGPGRLSLDYGLSYRNRFYRTWSENGSADTKAYISTQWVHQCSALWQLPVNAWSLRVACSNLTNTRIYDFYAIEKPGRAFSVTLNYQI